MRCSGSPTTCTAANPQTARDDDRIRSAAAQFEAVLFSAALAPLAKSLGFFGEIALDRLALTIARRDRGLAATFERLFER